MIDKSKWGTLDWRDWLDTQSEDAVVAELKWQEVLKAQALLPELEKALEEKA